MTIIIQPLMNMSSLTPTKSARKGPDLYYSVEIGTIDTWGYSIEYALSEFWKNMPDKAPFSKSSFEGIEPQPYTPQYFHFNSDKMAQVSIDGEDFVGTSAYSGRYEWYSGAESWPGAVSIILSKFRPTVPL